MSATLDGTAPSSGRVVVSGRYAGPATRLVAVLLDLVVVVAIYTVVVAVVDVLARTLFNSSVDGASGLPASILLAAWALVYLAVEIAVSGRTVGKMVVGLRVVRADGSPVRPGAAVLRALMFPLSIAFLGIGLLLILLDRRHRAFHDMVCGTVVVYDWGDRPAEMPGPLTAYLRDHGSL